MAVAVAGGGGSGGSSGSGVETSDESQPDYYKDSSELTIDEQINVLLGVGHQYSDEAKMKVWYHNFAKLAAFGGGVKATVQRVPTAIKSASTEAKGLLARGINKLKTLLGSRRPAFTQNVEFINGVKFVNVNKAVVNIEKTKRHFPGQVQEGKSILFGDIGDAQKLLDQYAGKGRGYFGPSSKKEVVDTGDKIIGVYFENGMRIGKTTRFTIHYSKTQLVLI